ncbi:hypothetical protein Plhal703r1_c42g0142801 [Plasmopara halstedii]
MGLVKRRFFKLLQIKHLRVPQSCSAAIFSLSMYEVHRPFHVRRAYVPSTPFRPRDALH